MQILRYIVKYKNNYLGDFRPVATKKAATKHTSHEIAQTRANHIANLYKTEYLKNYEIIEIKVGN